MSVIAIDGPAGAGKSTVARAVAKRLGYTYVDTGALYRALALAALRAGLSVDDAEELARLSGRIEVDLRDEMVFLDGEDVTARIRSKDVTEIVSSVAAHPEVRSSMGGRQRDIARGGGVVMEGRDIGTAIVPDATTKVFLTASLEERARRRFVQDSGGGGSLEEVTAGIEERDRSDSTRAASPLARHADAVVVDSTGLTVDEVVDRIAAVAARRAGR